MKRCLVVVLLAGACSNPSPSDNNIQPADPRLLVDDIAAAQCRKILACCPGDELESVLGPDITDQAGCEAAIVSQSQAFFLPSLERALAEDTIRLEESRLAGCISSLDSRTCEDFEPQASADVLRFDGCTELVVPRLTLSGFCTEDFECETGFCSHPPADTEGACKNPPQIGDDCLQGRCASFLACSADGVCVEKLGAGDVCTRNTDCRSDLCSPGDTGELVCETASQSCAG